MASTKNLRPLVINIRHEHAAGSEFTWNKLQSPKEFIGDIITPEIDLKNNEEIGRVISGIPTPFARPAMFKYAMSYVAESGHAPTPVETFYKSLQDEWKGLVACLALDNQPITVEKIDLAYSDGKPVASTSNIYEPKGALGNMLSLDADLWRDQVAQADATQRAKPFLYVIRYNGIIIGGTAPESLLFTAPAYELKVKSIFYSEITRKFVDPLSANPGREDLEKLLVYVRHVSNEMETYRSQFSRMPETQQLQNFLQRWLEDIELEQDRKGYDRNPNAIVPNLSKFGSPFDAVFNFKTTLFGWGGRISSDPSALGLPDGVRPIEVELSELLLDPATSTVAEIPLDHDDDVNRLGVHLLRATCEGSDRFFSLPLSEKGLAIFQDELEGLLKNAGGKKSRLNALYDAATETLRVTLQVDVNGTMTSFERHYREPTLVEGQRVVCWPDFVSRIWNKYYLYSELPHNGGELKAFPLRADRTSFHLITEGTGADFHFKKVAANGRKTDDDSTVNIIVEYDMNKIASTEIQYEVYESADPFKGVELHLKNKPAGYVLFQKLTTDSKFALRDYRNINDKLSPVRTGFDFGSNNICVSYAGEDHTPRLFYFNNRRRFLVGVDVQDNDKAAAAPHEVFFFQNERTPSNHVKSMIMLHDPRRVVGHDSDDANALGEVVKGGLPVFETNIPVENSADNRYKVRFANQDSFILYNMKWSNDRRENAYKASLLKALWLKTYAELLEENKYPESLVWAYPSAMETHRRTEYGKLWLDVGTINPLGGADRTFQNAKVAAIPDRRSGEPRRAIASDEPKAQTEAFSVCKHALGLESIQVDKRGLMIGLDVGGSTTDILCLAEKRHAQRTDEFPKTLIKEGSIRLAAGRLAAATAKSPKFQQVLKSYCLKKKIFIHGITVPPERLNENTAPFYYNLIVDRLQTSAELIDFYRSLSGDCNDLFTLNAFMTGLIMFYAGQLAHRIRQTQEDNPQDYHEPFSEVTIGCFGKGGRMFDWLGAISQDTANNYYYDCFFAGYGPHAVEHLRNFRIVPTHERFVKAEVSFGLSGTHEVHDTNDAIAELVGEDGFDYNGEPVDEIDAVEGRFFQNFGSQFTTPTEFPRFLAFSRIFRDFSREYFGFNLPSLEQDIRGMRLQAYVSNLPEYRAAQLAFQSTRSGAGSPAGEFEFVAPIIILEGMCFLDTVLAPKLFGR